MCMSVCRHACMRACVHACMHACMHVCMYVCMHVCMYVCMYVHRHEYANVGMHTSPLSPMSRRGPCMGIQSGLSKSSEHPSGTVLCSYRSALRHSGSNAPILMKAPHNKSSHAPFNGHGNFAENMCRPYPVGKTHSVFARIIY